MKKFLFLFALLILILIVPSVRSQTPANAPQWSMYTIKGERLSIALPALPALETSREPRTGSQKDRQRRVIRCAVKGVLYTIQVVENAKPRMPLETFIQEQAIANPAVNLTFERNLSLDGTAGKSFVYPDGKGMVQFFAKDDRIYDIRAYGAPVNDPRIATFFHYLSLKKQKDAFEISDAVQAESFDTATETVITGKEATTKARLISKPEPIYTRKARSKQITGTVVLKCIFAADGRVTNIRIIEGLPYGLTEQAIEAARKIRFIPATKDGKNVSMWMQLEYNFNLY